jgi:hypothetical protein
MNYLPSGQEISAGLVTEFTTFFEKVHEQFAKKKRGNTVSCALGASLALSQRPGDASICHSISFSHYNKPSVRNRRRISPPCK